MKSALALDVYCLHITQSVITKLFDRITWSGHCAGNYALRLALAQIKEINVRDKERHKHSVIPLVVGHSGPLPVSALTAQS